MITHLKQKRSIICESSTVDSQAHSSRGSNKRRYYSKMLFGQFLWYLRKDFIQCLWGTKETWKIVSVIYFVINPLQSWENVVFRINTKDTIDRHQSKYWTSFDIMKHWFSYYGISRNWNPPWKVQNDSIKSSKRKNLKKPLKKPSFSQNIVSAKINLFQDLTT